MKHYLLLLLLNEFDVGGTVASLQQDHRTMLPVKC